MKVCKNCLIEKDLNNFNKKKWWKLWVSSYCKECLSIKYKYLEYCKEYYYENKEYISKRRAIHRRNNPKLYKERQINYLNTERWKEIYRLSWAKRRVLKISTSDWTININSTTDLFNNQWGVCNLCWIDLNSNNIIKHLDHIQPISKWGVHSITNVQRLCSTCNLQKWAKI